MWRENFGDSAIIKGYIAYFYCAWAKQPYFYFRLNLTSSLCSSRLLPDFRKHTKNSAICVHLKQILIGVLIFCIDFKRSSWPKVGFLGDREGVVQYWPLSNFFTFGGSYVCGNFGKNRSRNQEIKKCDRESAHWRIHWHTDRLKDWQTQTGFIICPMPYAIAMEQIILSIPPPVCPSVCHTCGLWQNGRKICPDLYTIRRNI